MSSGFADTENMEYASLPGEDLVENEDRHTKKILYQMPMNRNTNQPLYSRQQNSVNTEYEYEVGFISISQEKNN